MIESNDLYQLELKTLSESECNSVSEREINLVVSDVDTSSQNTRLSLQVRTSKTLHIQTKFALTTVPLSAVLTLATSPVFLPTIR